MSDPTVTAEASTSPWDSLRHPIWLFDPETCRGLYANPPAMALWDAETLDELLARDFSKLSPAVRTRTERLARATANGEAVTERWTFYPKGQPVTVQAVISTYVQAGGRSVLLFEATPIDVEDGERRAVEALRHTSSLITLFTPDGRPVFANPAAIATYGDSVSFCERFSDRAYGLAVLEVVRAGDILAELVEVLTLSGTRSHHIDARQVLDPVTGEAAILFSERDVTAQVEAERALLIAEERASIAVAKEQLISNVSHELRTPLTSVLGYSALLKTEEGLSKRAHERLDKIAEAGERLLEIVNNIILLREIDKGEFQIRLSDFTLSEVVQEVADKIGVIAARKGLHIRLELPNEFSSSLIGDKDKIQKVLEIFASNAVRYTERGEITFGANTETKRNGRTAVSFFVRDTGTGLRTEDQQLIFDRFSLADETPTVAGGAGIGLAISKSLATALGGEVGVTSSIGQGSTFYVNLQLATRDVTDPTEAIPAKTTGATKSQSILYADDHENNRILVGAIIESLGHSCDFAEDGVQAVKAAVAHKYDLILMDIQMPLMDGIVASREIRQLEGLADVPIIALTANTQDSELIKYEDAGIDDCLSKPIIFRDLVERIAYWTQRRR